jgi:hypothetical protein
MYIRFAYSIEAMKEGDRKKLAGQSSLSQKNFHKFCVTASTEKNRHKNDCPLHNVSSIVALIETCLTFPPV